MPSVQSTTCGPRGGQRSRLGVELAAGQVEVLDRHGVAQPAGPEHRVEHRHLAVGEVEHLDERGQVDVLAR